MNVLFIHVPKTAGSSISKALDLINLWSRDKILRKQPHSGMLRFGHQPYAKLVDAGWITPEFDRTSFKFSFVRNPYDRAVSAYLDTCRAGLSGWINDDEERAGQLRPKHFYMRWAREVGFLGFCREMYGKPFKPLVPSNGRPDQSNIFCPITWFYENVSLDFVGRFESLQDDFKLLLEELQLRDIELPWEKPTRGTANRPHYSTYYCEETFKLVSNAYKEDLAMFGYTYE